MTGELQSLLTGLRRIAGRTIAPLKSKGGPDKFRLSSAETATTTIDGSVGWGNRPPAALECARCGSTVHQVDAYDAIDCPRCIAAFDHDKFADLELLYLECPVCRSELQYGQRHPNQFDFPEWATCDSCRYHWEFTHSY